MQNDVNSSKESKRPSPFYSPSYPTADSLPRLQERRRRNIIIILIALLVLVLVTYIELRYLGSHTIGVLALFNINIILLLVLLLLIFRNIFKMVLERRQKTAGSHFRARLVFAFVVLSMIPTVFLVIIGSNLMADAIKSWFNPEIEQFINSAMDAARQTHAFAETYLTNSSKSLARNISVDKLLTEEHRDELMRLLTSSQTEYNLALIQLFNSQGFEIWRGAQKEFTSSVFFDPAHKDFNEVLQGNEFLQVNILASGEMLQKGVPIYNLDNPELVEAILITNLFLPQEITQDIRSIQRNYEIYKRQKISIRPTQGLYISIFVTLAMTILFAAVWIGLYIARQISIPISHMVEATDQIASGNLDFRINILAYDEIGRLVQSFNRMIAQLKANKDTIDAATIELKATNMEIRRRQNQLETILKNIGAGVLSVDLQGKIATWNHRVAAILDISETDAMNRNFEEVLNKESLFEFCNTLKMAFDNRLSEFQKEMHIQTSSRVLVCSMSFAPLWDANDSFCGIVVVMDDLTQFIRIQRIAAWREVARRLAHEIKNPLTPIQLHAQRMQKKYEAGAADFPDVFHEATTSIINEVNGLRILLDEFSQFARLPEPHFQRGHIHEVLDQALSLYSKTYDSMHFRTTLDPALPYMMMDFDQIKRAFINLIDNAIEAVKASGSLQITTKYDSNRRTVQVFFSDDGPGVPALEREKIFLPHFSTKARGSGLGLAICNRIVSDHNGTIRVQDNLPRGATFIVELPVYLEMAKDVLA